jgi:hypothetical protein
MRHPSEALSVDPWDYLLRISFSVAMKKIEIALDARYPLSLVY